MTETTAEAGAPAAEETKVEETTKVAEEEQAKEEEKASGDAGDFTNMKQGDKFWKIKREEAKTTVFSGKIGNAGSKQEKDHGSEDAAKAFVDKQVAAKTKAGFESCEASDIQPKPKAAKPAKAPAKPKAEKPKKPAAEPTRRAPARKAKTAVDTSDADASEVRPTLSPKSKKATAKPKKEPAKAKAPAKAKTATKRKSPAKPAAANKKAKAA